MYIWLPSVTDALIVNWEAVFIPLKVVFIPKLPVSKVNDDACIVNGVKATPKLIDLIYWRLPSHPPAVKVFVASFLTCNSACVPWTESFEVGDVVPIPTLPPCIQLSPSVLNLINPPANVPLSVFLPISNMAWPEVSLLIKLNKLLLVVEVIFTTDWFAAEALIVNFVPGAVVPIPTLPSFVTLILGYSTSDDMLEKLPLSPPAFV